MRGGGVVEVDAMDRRLRSSVDVAVGQFALSLLGGKRQLT